MLPDSISTTIVLAGLGWLGFCFRQWDVFPDSAEKWIRDHDQYRSGHQTQLLTTILSFTLPDLMRSYLTLETAEVDPVVNRDALVAVVASIDAEPAVHDVRIRENVTKPLLLGVTARIVDDLPRLVAEVIAQPAALEGVQSLGCYALDLDQFRRRKTRLTWRYQLQCALLGSWLVGIVLAYLATGSWWTVEAAIAVGIAPVVHGVDLELRRQRLKGDLASGASDTAR